MLVGRLVDTESGPQFPNDTLIYGKYANQYYLEWDNELYQHKALTIDVPEGTVIDGPDQDHMWIWISNRNPPWQDVGVDPLRSANDPWSFVDFPGLSANKPDCALFHKSPSSTPNDPDDKFYIPADINGDLMAISQFITGQNAGSFSQRYRSGATGIVGGLGPSTGIWTVGPGSFTSDTNVLEHLWLYRVYESRLDNTDPLVGPEVLSTIDTAGGWIQAINDVQKINFTGFDVFSEVEVPKEWYSWSAWYYRFMPSSPDGNSTLERTINWGPKPIVGETNKTRYFGVYWRSELGF